MPGDRARLDEGVGGEGGAGLGDVRQFGEGLGAQQFHRVHRQRPATVFGYWRDVQMLGADTQNLPWRRTRRMLEQVHGR